MKYIENNAVGIPSFRYNVRDKKNSNFAALL